MAIIKCPECNRDVSDQAYMCPGCGFPITVKKVSTQRRRSQNKRKRLPNGLGSITEIKGKNLRNPFFARVPAGKDPFGRYLQKPLQPQAYFSTYEDAFAALYNYKKEPYSFDSGIRCFELYDQWTDKYFEEISASSTRSITSAWAYCSAIYNIRVSDLRARHIKGCMEEGTVIIPDGPDKGQTRTPSPSTKSRIKSLFNLMLDYALEYEIVTINYARTFELSGNVIKELEKAKVDHIIFTDAEISLLWKNIDTLNYINVVLVQIYSGWRPQELGLLRLEDVDLEHWTFTGGMKTDAGHERLVPIHTKIRPLVKALYDEAVSLNSEYLINCTDATKSGLKMTYDKYAYRFKKIISFFELNEAHRPHDPRMTFITMAKEADMNEHVLKSFVGHSDTDVTEAVYTKRSLDNLISEMEKIK